MGDRARRTSPLQSMSRSSDPRRSRPLKGQTNALADADAKTYQGKGLSLPTQSIDGGHYQTRTARAKRMPKRDRAAVAVDMLGIVGQSETTRTREHLSGKGLV